MSITEKFTVVTFKILSCDCLCSSWWNKPLCANTWAYHSSFHSFIHSSVHLHFTCYFFVLFSPCNAPTSGASFPYVTVVEFCPRMAHQAMNTSLWTRKDQRKTSFSLYFHLIYDIWCNLWTRCGIISLLIAHLEALAYPCFDHIQIITVKTSVCRCVFDYQDVTSVRLSLSFQCFDLKLHRLSSSFFLFYWIMSR